jgi:hypothetical protein
VPAHTLFTLSTPSAFSLKFDAGSPTGNYFLTRPGQVKALRAGG